jgi:hypothetical protein
VRQGFGGDAGVGEVTVEEAGSAGNLVEREAATVAGQVVDRFEDLEPQGDQLFESPPDLIPCEVHGLVEARDLRDLFERLWTFAQARDGALVKVAPSGDPGKREPAF